MNTNRIQNSLQPEGLQPLSKEDIERFYLALSEQICLPGAYIQGAELAFKLFNKFIGSKMKNLGELRNLKTAINQLNASENFEQGLIPRVICSIDATINRSPLVPFIVTQDEVESGEEFIERLASTHQDNTQRAASPDLSNSIPAQLKSGRKIHVDTLPDEGYRKLGDDEIRLLIEALDRADYREAKLRYRSAVEFYNKIKDYALKPDQLKIKNLQMEAYSGDPMKATLNTLAFAELPEMGHYTESDYKNLGDKVLLQLQEALENKESQNVMKLFRLAAAIYRLDKTSDSNLDALRDLKSKVIDTYQAQFQSGLAQDLESEKKIQKKA